MYLNWILKVHFFLRVTSLFLVTVIMSQRQLLSDWKVNPEAFSGSIDVHPGQHTGALCIEPLSCLEWILVEVICVTSGKNAENTSSVCLVPCCQEDFLCQGLILHSGTSLWVADVSAAASELWQSDSHCAETSGPSDSATEGYWCFCSVFAEKLGDQVLFQYVSSSAVPDIPSPSDLLIKEVLPCWGSFSLSISLGWPLVSAAFHHFTISSHCILLLWKSWECSPTASSHPSCQACSGLSAILLWRAKIE